MLARIDRSFDDGAQRFMLRVATSRVTKPDFFWSPYRDFVSPLKHNATGVALTWIGALRPTLTAEARVGWSTDDLFFDRANSQVPLLAGPSGMRLPGSTLYYSYRNHTRNLESIGSIMLTKSRHALKLGGGLLERRIDGYHTTAREAQVPFTAATDLAADQPFSITLTVPRAGLTGISPSHDRNYAYRQWFGYFQGSWRAASRLNFNYGVRYENFGAPVNTGGVKDTLIALGRGNSLQERLASADGFWTPARGDQRLYDSDNLDWVGRAGFAYVLDERARTVIRGAFGLFYDRPFDNLWQTVRHNALQYGTAFLQGRSWDYLHPAQAFPGPVQEWREIFQGATLFQPGFRTPYVQSAFVSVRKTLTYNLSIELAAMNSLGRKLIATDSINRSHGGRTADKFPSISYRSNQGNSNYHSGAVVVAGRGRRHYFEVTYTWSHAIDNQSDALVGEYTDLSFTSNQPGEVRPQAAFTVQYDSRADRGNSDFDQRHSLVTVGVVELPSPRAENKAAALFRDWRISWMAAARSGSPYSVYADAQGDSVLNNRANLSDPADVNMDIPQEGGKTILNAAAFSAPANGILGNTGRNTFRGPGFWNVDLSLSRTIHLSTLGKQGRLTIRGDAFNVLNQANLGTPITSLASKNFGLALFGRRGYDIGFPAVVPFRESARAIQLLLRVEF
jgi:hypothetical protein